MSENDIELCKTVEPHELIEVKSQAIVRYAAMQAPAKFNRLQCNTNLNLPPSNWLTSAGTYGLHQSLYQVPGFSSFRLAHMFPDCVGDVDVVSDAENIKKLLKLAYSPKGVISMLVHTVGNSLLLDEFDIQKYLMRRSDDDWNWLRSFILEKLLAYGGEPNNFCLKDKSREAIQTKNLLSKFLYYSLKQSLPGAEPSLVDENSLPPRRLITKPVLPEPKIEEKVPDPQTSQHAFNRNVLWTFEDIRMLIGTDMPIFGGPNRPCISLRLRDMSKPINVLTGIDYWLDNLMCNVPEVVMCYHLDGLVQKYEIIKTEDLPYLENSQFSPQIVRNMAHNILAFLKANATKEGHTYWLFKARNDDVVKLYDLTDLCKNQSTPSTKHNSKRADEKPENPFTVPVAMLLYTVARNIKNTAQRVTPRIAGNIRALLENSIKLLPREKYPQIITSSHYILADLYIPDGVDPKSPKFDTDVDFDADSVYEEDEENDHDDSYFEEAFAAEFRQQKKNTQLSEHDANAENFAVGQIAEMTKYNFGKPGADSAQERNAPLLVASVEERCRLALEHINAGISCLQFFNECEDNIVKESQQRANAAEKERIIHEEQNQNMALPNKPIALPYESLNSQRDDATTKRKPSSEHKNGKEENTNNKLMMCSVGESDRFGSWTMHLKLLLVQKACLVYATLGEQNYLAGRYGACLKAIYMSSRCQALIKKHMPNIVSQKSCLLGRAGDCLFQLANNWHSIDAQLTQFNEHNAINENISNELEKDLSDEDLSYIILPTKSVEELMIASCKCYENALSAAPEATHHELLRRLGNVSNELGIKYMHWAQEEYNKCCKHLEMNESNEAHLETNEEKNENPTAKNSSTPLYNELAMKSYDALIRGIAVFDVVDDNVNLAFLYCNMGRYMRFRAHLISTPTQLTIACQKRFYEEAFEFYEKAKTTLDTRKRNPELWDLVNWELCTATFSLANLLQNAIIDHKAEPSLYEKDVLDYLQKALKFCDVDHVCPRQVLYIYRTGVIHRLIAAHHSWHIRRAINNAAESGSSVSKTSLQLFKIHIDKAIGIFESLSEGNDLLLTHAERLTLQEMLMENASQPLQKVKHLETALDICLSAKRALQFVIEQPTTTVTTTTSTTESSSSDDDGANENSTISEEFLQNSQILERRLQLILRTLIKLLLGTKDPKKRVDDYKKLYMDALKLDVERSRMQQHQTAEIETETSSLTNSSRSLMNSNYIYIQNLYLLLNRFEDTIRTFQNSKSISK